MARWEPDAKGRLQEAAMALFAEHGYADVTVAEIADRAGLTKRSFFNHFPDKREVLFAGAADFEAAAADQVARASAGAPLDVAVRGLTVAGSELGRYAEFAAARQQLVSSSSELRERELIKLAALTDAVAAALVGRGVPVREASLAARAGVAVFDVAYADWVRAPSEPFDRLVQVALEDLRRTVAGGVGQAGVERRASTSR